MNATNATAATPLLPLTRPDGRIYRPRKIIACAMVDDDELLNGVVVLGTHDVAAAQLLADSYAAWQLGRGHRAAGPETGWYRLTYSYGDLIWADDEVRGRAGVFFRKIREYDVTCPSCGSDDPARCWYVPGSTGIPVDCPSDWHDDDARGPG